MVLAIPLLPLTDSAPTPGGTTRAHALLRRELAEVSIDYVAVAQAGGWFDPGRRGRATIWFVLDGAGEFVTRQHVLRFGAETVAYQAPGESMRIAAARRCVVRAVRVRKALTSEDTERLKTGSVEQAPYVRAFAACPAYGEAIKSARTISRTILLPDLVPRVAAGMVETDGPDEVQRHRHVHVEQLFIGLRENDASVMADEAVAAFPAFSVLHIPRGSWHGARVEAGRRLRYIWIDFFPTRAAEAWLDSHRMLAASERETLEIPKA